MRLPGIFLLFFSFQAWGVILPVCERMEQLFRTRKEQPVFEVALREVVTLGTPGVNAEEITVEERWVRDQRDYLVLVKFPTGQQVGFRRLKDEYVNNTGAKFPSKSRVMPKLLLEYSGPNFLSQLFAEGFLKRDECSMFSGEYKAEGDPNHWEPSKYYLKHPGIRLHRFPDDGVIAVKAGIRADSEKAIFINPSSLGVVAVRWQEKPEAIGWRLLDYANFPGTGMFPSRLEFERGGKTLVKTHLQRARILKPKDLLDFQKQFAAAEKAPLPPKADEALQLLLSYR